MHLIVIVFHVHLVKLGVVENFCWLFEIRFLKIRISIECNLIVQYQRNKIIYILKVSKRGIEREKIGNLQDLIPRARIQFDL